MYVGLYIYTGPYIYIKAYTIQYHCSGQNPGSGFVNYCVLPPNCRNSYWWQAMNYCKALRLDGVGSHLDMTSIRLLTLDTI